MNILKKLKASLTAFRSWEVQTPQQYQEAVRKTQHESNLAKEREMMQKQKKWSERSNEALIESVNAQKLGEIKNQEILEKVKESEKEVEVSLDEEEFEKAA